MTNTDYHRSLQLMAQANQQQMLLQQVQADLIQQTKVRSKVEQNKVSNVNFYHP